jgi:hypothetical protein
MSNQKKKLVHIAGVEKKLRNKLKDTDISEGDAREKKRALKAKLLKKKSCSMRFW